MIIEYLWIERHKRFEDTEVNFNTKKTKIEKQIFNEMKLTVVIGENGAGKTTILSFIAHIFRNLERYHERIPSDFIIQYNISGDIIKIEKKNDMVYFTVNGRKKLLVKRILKYETKKKHEYSDLLSTRLYAITTILAYGGLRISECLNLKIDNINFISKDIIITNGKGNKQRAVYMNSKIENSIKRYLKIREPKGEHLFISRERDRLDRTVINKEFKRYSNVITPHMLRHFFCSNALENGFTIAEVANLAGHKSVQTTLIYTNPSIEKMKIKMELL